MKEVTYEDWQKNPTPRMMWVWNNNNEEEKVQRNVIYFIENKSVSHPVVALSNDGTILASYKHCAEIEKRRMTNKELSRWLRENPTRECKYPVTDYICSVFEYRDCKQDAEVCANIYIRENDGEWREPLVEVKE